jgi:4'-phosphopantetheinyl transferase
VLRETLGEYFGCHPGDLVFDRGTYGKPRLAMRIEYPFSFNLSHSDRYTLVAYGNCSSIGADVEVIGGLAHTDGLADAILSREEAARFSSPDSEWLVRIWTVKEAILKATGEGLSRSMKDVRVLSASLRRPVIELAGEDSSGEEWHLMYQEPRCGVAVAIAAKATEVPKFQFMDLTD